MSLIVLNGLGNLGTEVSKRPFFAGAVLFVCGFAYYIFTDFLKTYVRRPSHFVHRSVFGGLFGRKKFNAPLIARKPGESYREVLARGSALVRSNDQSRTSSTKNASTLIGRTRSSIFPMRL
jgi:hypothetical protein